MRRMVLAVVTVVAMLGVVAPAADARGGPPAHLFPDVSVADAVAAESDGVLTFEVSIPEPTKRPIQIWYSTRSGSARPFRDYVPVIFGRTTIPRGETSTTITIRLIDDDRVGDNVDFELLIRTAPRSPAGAIAQPAPSATTTGRCTSSTSTTTTPISNPTVAASFSAARRPM